MLVVRVVVVGVVVDVVIEVALEGGVGAVVAVNVFIAFGVVVADDDSTEPSTSTSQSIKSM